MACRAFRDMHSLPQPKGIASVAQLGPASANGTTFREAQDGINARLRNGEIHVWRMQFASGAASKQTYSVMNDDERTRASAFRFAGDRERFCRSRVFLRQILGRYLRLDPADIVFGKGPHGKPLLELTKVSSPELNFNLSHCRSVALLAVAIGQPVGIDVEDAANAQTVDPCALARDFLAPTEAQAICEFVDFSDRLRTFLDCWTRKEAVLKAAGLGLLAKLDSFEVPLDGTRSARVAWSSDTMTEHSAFDVVSLSAGEIFAAVAAPRIAGPIFSFEFANLDSYFPDTLAV